MKIATDKKKHFGAGMFIASLTGIFTTIKELSDLWILFPVILIGGAKELIWDLWKKKGCAELLDFVATVLGGLVVYLIFLFF